MYRWIKYKEACFFQKFSTFKHHNFFAEVLYFYSYDSTYENIVANHTVSSTEFNGGEEGTGKLDFTLITHDDDSFDSPLEDTDISTVGERIYFSVNIHTPIIGVEFAVSGKYCIFKIFGSHKVTS